MQREAAIGAQVPASHTPGHYGRLTLWALGCAVVVVIVHSALPAFSARLGSYRSGIAAAAVFALAAAYSVRKRWMWLSVRVMRLAALMPHPVAHRLLIADRLESWRLYHVIFGAGVLLPLWWHLEGGAGASPLEAALGALAALLLLSGLAGSIIQDYLPHTMRVRPGLEVRPEDVDAAIHDLYVEAEEAILGRSEALVQAYLRHLRPLMLGAPSAFTMLAATIRGADPAAAVTARLREEGAPENEAATWNRLIALTERKVRLDHNRFDLALGVGWMRIHIAIAIGVGVLTAFHIAGVLYFAGL